MDDVNVSGKTIILAKSNPPETLEQHIKTELDYRKTITNLYGSKILCTVPQKFQDDFYLLLDIIIKYHDLGKVYTPFQNNLRKRIKNKKLSPLETKVDCDVRHNLLSLAFLNNKTVKNLIKKLGKPLKEVLYSVVGYHHFHKAEMDIKNMMSSSIEKIMKNIETAIEKDINYFSRFKELEKFFKLDLPEEIRPISFKNLFKRDTFDEVDDDLKRLYIMLKGLFHRIDYSASANVTIETEKIIERKNKVMQYLLSKGISEQKIWQHSLAVEYQDENIILIASTGLGKTEFAYMWAGNDKTFYTLPVRVSVNTMFERTLELFQQDGASIALMHSDAKFYSLQKKNSEDNIGEEEIFSILEKVNLSRLLSANVSVSTADQLFTSALKYPSYENVYATLAYSRLIIDEIQSYNPELVAVIIKCIEDVVKLGCRVCVMTATLPPFYIDELKKAMNCSVEKHIFNLSKHKLSICRDQAIIDENAIRSIINAFENHPKVLVICNTVKQAQDVYRKIVDYISSEEVYCLHSRFMFKDRQRLEQLITDKTCSGIWVTTQLVEASLDIDFDVLFTELCTIDSLVQRMGRINRSIRTDGYCYEGKPNVFVFTEYSGKSIYENVIVERTLEILNTHEGIISEEDKQEMVNYVYDKDALDKLGSRFYKKYRDTKEVLNLGFEAGSKSHAQELFRRIYNMNIIPKCVFEKNEDEINNAIKKYFSKDLVERLTAQETIRGYCISEPIYRVQNAAKKSGQILGSLDIDSIYLASFDYSLAEGLLDPEDYMIDKQDFI